MTTEARDLVPAGAWVEVHRVVLAAGDRAPRVPRDTRAVPLEMRVRGCLVAPARLGEEVDIATRAGRTLSGTLVAVEPAYTHGFGPPVLELTAAGDEARALLAAWRRSER